MRRDAGSLGYFQRQELGSREAHRRGIADADVDACDVSRAEGIRARDERDRRVDGSPERTAHGFELTGRRAPVARDVVAVVTLLVRAGSTGLDDAVATIGELAVRAAIGVVRLGAARTWLGSGIALLDARLDLAIAARRLETVVRAGPRRAVGGTVIAGLARIDLSVPAEITLLARAEPVGRHGEVVAGLGCARDDTGGKWTAATDVGSGEARTRLHDLPRATRRAPRRDEARRRDEAEGRCRPVDRLLAAHRLREDLMDDRRPHLADRVDASMPTLSAGRRRPLQRCRAAVERRLHQRAHRTHRRRRARIVLEDRLHADAPRAGDRGRTFEGDREWRRGAGESRRQLGHLVAGLLPWPALVALIDRVESRANELLHALADVVPTLEVGRPDLRRGLGARGWHTPEAEPDERSETERQRTARVRRAHGNPLAPDDTPRSHIKTSPRSLPHPSIGEDGAGSAEPAPKRHFNHGTVTAQVTVVGSTTLPRSSDASVTLQVKSAAVAAGAPWHVWKVKVSSGDGSPPSLTASTVKP